MSLLLGFMMFCRIMIFCMTKQNPHKNQTTTSPQRARFPSLMDPIYRAWCGIDAWVQVILLVLGNLFIFS